MKKVIKLNFWRKCILACIGFLPLYVLAQSGITVRGTVSDPQKEPIIGATIIIKGNATQGTITDMDGKYELNDVPSNGTLVFSFVGTKTQEIPVNGRSTIDVTMAEDDKLLDEVVVVGYGVQRKSDLTGAVSSVKVADALKDTPTADVANALQGRLAGVSVVSEGDPSKDHTIRVRGINSINAETGPLVVIDGFIGGSLKNLNPVDIQSVEVLKDASSTAVYGSRGANGVVLITTKSADKDRISINFNSFVNFKTVLKYPDVLSPAEFARLANDYGREYMLSDGGKPAKIYYTEEQIKAFEAGTDGYDYVRNIFNDPAVSQNYELSISGKSNKISFLASTRYEKSEGIIRRSTYDQFNWRLKLDVDIKPWVKTGLNFWGSFDKNSGPRMTQYEGLLISASNYPNTVKPTDANGNYNNVFAIGGLAAYNPMGYINEMDDHRKELVNRLQGYVDFKITKGLNFRSQIGVSFGNSMHQALNNERSYYFFKNAHTMAEATSAWNFNWLNTNILTYIRDFNRNHRINATAVFEQSSTDTYKHTSRATHLAFANRIGYNNLGWADYFDASSNKEINTLMSGMLRINYVLMNRYMLTASLRADGSSNLDKKWDYFPSMAFAWDMKREHFMEQVNWLDQLKFRVGYGSVGNQAVTPYRIFSKMEPVRNADGTTSYAVDRPKAPYLEWERNDQINFGVDFIAFNGRIKANIDVYDKRSKNILLSVAQPVHTGWSELLKNAGTIRNKGIEITLGVNPIRRKEFDWQSDLTLSHNKGVFETIPTPNGMQNQSGEFENKIFKMIEGEKLGTFWGYQYLGVWKKDEINQPFVKPDGTTTTNGAQYKVVPGQAKYKDVNGDGIYNNKDQGIIGNGQPSFNWGWNNTFSFKNIDMTVFIVGYHGFDIYNATEAIAFNSILGQAVDVLTPNKALLKRWTPENENSSIPGFVKQKRPLRGFSDRFVEKGDFIKVKSITLGYTLPNNLLQKAGLYNFRIYASVQNPFHITKYSGLDPEATLGAPLVQGVDWGAYPNARSYMVGINVSL